MPVKIYVFFFSHSLALLPSSNGMRNVWRENRMPLLGLQFGTGDVVASNALYWETTSSFRALLLASPQDVKGYLLGTHLSIQFSNVILVLKAVHPLTQASGDVRYYTLFASPRFTSHSPKRVNICLRALRCDLWFQSYPPLGNQ